MTALRPILLTILFALSTFALGLGMALAATVKIEANTTMFELASACGTAGGSFNVHDDGGYSCVKHDCDGEGGACGVGCDSGGSCEGTTPSQLNLSLGMTLIGLLQNGNMVFYDKTGSFGGGGLSSSSDDSEPILRE